MFFYKEVDKFFLYRFNDYKIDIMLEKEPGFDYIYKMSQNEFNMFKKYLNNNFAKGFIRLNYLFIISLVFFTRKLNKDLYLYVNYQALNAIIIKN